MFVNDLLNIQLNVG